MKFIIKKYRVPVKITEGKADYVEVPMNKDNFKGQEDTEIDSQVKISMEAVNISNWNNTQLRMAEMDESITHVFKKVICKTD